MRAIIDAAPKPGTMKCPQFSPTVLGSDMCKCGHVLYAHYMCGDPRESACLSCGKVTPSEEPKSEVPVADDMATLERKLHLAEMSAAASARALESSNHAALEIGKALGCSAVTSDIIDHIHELQRTISRLAAQVEPTSPSICERSVKESFPVAHCVPLAHAVYPSFYVIRQDREEWSPELGTGRVPDEAWANAMIKIQNDKGARAAEATEIKP